MVKQCCLELRQITTNFKGVQKFRRTMVDSEENGQMLNLHWEQ